MRPLDWGWLAEPGDVWVLHDDREGEELWVVESRGTIYDIAANVGAGYTGTSYARSRHPGSRFDFPVVLETKVGKSWLRKLVKRGEARLIARFGDADSANAAVNAWAEGGELTVRP